MGVQQRTQGNDRSAAAAIHGKGARHPIDGQYDAATAIIGNDAAA